MKTKSMLLGLMALAAIVTMACATGAGAGAVGGGAATSAWANIERFYLERDGDGEHAYAVGPGGKKEFEEKLGYKYEGQVGMVALAPTTGLVPLYRYTSPATGDNALAALPARVAELEADGYLRGDRLGYVSPEPRADFNPLYEFLYGDDLFYTIDAKEAEEAYGNDPASYLGVALYAFAPWVDAARDAAPKAPPLVLSGSAAPTPFPVGEGQRVVDIQAGAGFALALKADGSLWAWGANESGQLGDGTWEHKARPVEVLRGVKSFAAGDAHALAVLADGSLYAWGLNYNAQLGLGDTVARNKPALVLKGAKAAFAGSSQSFALMADGQLLGWGGNWNGQTGVGEGMKADRPEPVRIEGVVKVAARENQSYFLKADGTLWGAGYNVRPGVDEGYALPVQVLDEVADVSAAGAIFARKRDGSTIAWAWGTRAITLDRPIAALGEGIWESCVIDKAGSLLRVDFDWDAGTARYARIARAVAKAARGTGWTLALDAAGRLYSWGDNARGQLGNGTEASLYAPAMASAAGQVIDDVAIGAFTLGVMGGKVFEPAGEVAGLADVVAVDSSGGGGGFDSAYALTRSGELWAWGGDRGPAPKQILDGVLSVRAGNQHAAALKKDGTVWVWCVEWSEGSYGDGDRKGREVPAKVEGLPPIASIAGTNGWHILAVDRDGGLWAWGNNDEGQLGLGDNGARKVPAKVPGLPPIAKAWGGRYASFALDRTGTLWSWGRVLAPLEVPGEGWPWSSSIPRKLSIKGVVDMALGGDEWLAGGFFCFIKSDGSLWGFGSNDSGQRGTPGAEGYAVEPLKVAEGVKKVVASWKRMAFLKTDGSAWVCGENFLLDFGKAKAVSAPTQVEPF